MVLSFLRAKAESGGIEADLLLVNCGLHDIRTDPETGTRQVLYCDHVHFQDHIRQKQAAFVAGWLMAFAPPEKRAGTTDRH